MIGLAIAATGAFGVYLLVTVRADRPSATVARRPTVPWSTRGRLWLDQAGLAEVGLAELVGVSALVTLVGAVIGALMFGGVLPSLALGAFAGTAPLAAYRQRRATRRAEADEAWPAMIDEIRVLCGSAGRSIPQALLDVGTRGPASLRPGFHAARRTWVLTTDFEATTATLKGQLASPTADATCETLLVAHQLGGGDLDRRLADLAEDRRQDVLGRKDARAKQAGVRFARRFVIIVPLGMAAAGMSLGEGRASYQSATGQLLVAVGIGLVVACWIWSGRIMRLPGEDRVFG